MKPLFPSPPPPPPMPRDPDRAVLVRKALPERLLETLRYLAEEIDLRRVGGLGEAQAAGYIAGRLQRAEQQATVTSFTTGLGHTVAVGLIGLVAAVGSAAAAMLPTGDGARGAQWATLLLVPALAALLWGEVEGPGLLGQVIGSRGSQSVIGVRAAVSSARPSRTRVVLTAPLDSAPRLPSRRMLLLLLQLLGLAFGLFAALLVFQQAALRWAILGVSLLLLVTALALLGRRLFDGPRPAILGAGELAVLVAIAEELGELQQVELWTVALGAVSAGDAGIRHLLDRYPFGADTCFINLHHMTAGQPVYVTREGLLREHRSDRRLLALASDADAADVTINAEPRRIRRRTLAAIPLRRGYRAITITSHTDSGGFVSPDPRTLERCVKLVVGIIRELDREENTP